MIYIGQASKLTGASIKAIRHYEAQGLLPELSRVGVYRVFTERDINMIKLIKKAQDLGFKLAELKTAILANQHKSSWQEIIKLLRIKELQLSQTIEHLQTKQLRLHEYVQEIEVCLEHDPTCDEPLV